MFLRSTTIPDIYRLITETPSDLRKLRGAELSLTAALFLALAHRHAQDTGATNLAQSILDLNLPGVAPATHCLQSASTQKSADPFGAPCRWQKRYRMRQGRGGRLSGSCPAQ